MSALMVEGWVVYWHTLRRDRRTCIASGAFDTDLRDEAAVPVLLDHDETLELGLTRALGRGLSSVRALPQGLRFTLCLAAGSVADALERAVRQRRITGCSHALQLDYVTRPGQRVDGPYSTIVRAGLREISILTTEPAYPGTSLRVWRLGSSVGQRCSSAQATAILDHLTTRRAA